MTCEEYAAYYPLMMGEWQYKAAFVIQFQTDTDLEAGRCEGRIEHIASCRAIRFHSLEELLAFIKSVLTEPGKTEEL